MERYDPQAIEAKWQKVWADEKSFHVPNPDPAELAGGERRKSFVVEMLPYPSGDLHMGHTLNYTIGDVITHTRRRQGMQVLRPMGYDAFGLPAENAAIKEGGHPRTVTERNIVSIREQMHRMGWAIDWGREISTADPAYYRWTQWLFLRFYEKGLAYRKEAPVKWCPNDQTVLANEQVVDGHCERCGAEVEAKILTQWYFRITDYADALLDEMADLEDWPDRVLTMQRNWIGRSQGARVVFSVEGSGEELPGLHDAARHAVRSDVLRPGTREPDGRAARRRLRARGRGARVRPPHRRPLRGRAGDEGEGRRLHRAVRDQPRQRREDSDLGRRLRADGVRHRRDHGRAGARRARLRVRRALRDRDSARRHAGGRGAARGGRVLLSLGERGARQLRPVHRAAEPRGEGEDRRLAGRAGSRRGDDRLPPARLAVLAPALLGLPDPDHPLSRLRRGRRARRSAAGRPARHHGGCAEGSLAARRGRGLGQRDLPDVRRRGAPRDRHDGHVRRLVVVLHPLHGSRQLGGCRSTAKSRTTGCPSTSTSAASSMPCSTCSTRASSRR